MDRLMIDHVITQLWACIGLFSLLRNLLPQQLLQWLKRWFFLFEDRFDKYYELDIERLYGEPLSYSNPVYQDVDLYLPTLNPIKGARRLTVCRTWLRNSTEFGLDSGETIQESFNGATVWWSRHAQQVGSDSPTYRHWFSLKIERRNKRLLWTYFDHIAKRAAEIKKDSERITIYANDGEKSYGWTGIPFKHPSTFDSLALDPTMKDKIIKDLDSFKKGKEFHNRVGRAWKRGYLLYGPPGTGKSSLVAAIANYMKYDVYDLDLTTVADNSELRRMLLHIKNGSLIVIEDIDCSLDLRDRLSQPLKHISGSRVTLSGVRSQPLKHISGSRVTLSGVLNFTDGLWSCCGGERIIIFTTNHKDRLDPALLRSGRMDMHIHLSFCTFSQFKSLAFNYLQIEDHPLFSAVEESMREAGAEMTPAEISEILISHLEDPLKALNAVISALNDRVKSKSVTQETAEHTVTEETTDITQDGVDPPRKKSSNIKV